MVKACEMQSELNDVKLEDKPQKLPTEGNIALIKLRRSLRLITVRPPSLCSPSHLSPSALNLDLTLKEADAVAADHCFRLLVLALWRIPHNLEFRKLDENSSERRKLEHWGQLSCKTDSFI